ncbi:MAG TPA: hypothetical protein VJI69_05660, partial [Bacteroidia bacterium]|nr:hypothetical protein [Bacteroidia bacterium]
FASVVQPPEVSPKKQETMKVMNNIIAINTFDLLFTNLSLSYERFSKSGLWSVKIPVSVGFGGKKYNEKEYYGGTSTQFLQNRLYSGGLELNIYPFKRTKNTFYAGISAVAGSFVYYEYIVPQRTQYTGGTGTQLYLSAAHVKHIGAHYSCMLHVGGYLSLTENILFGAKTALGFKREETIENDYLFPRLQLDLNCAYRF